MNTLAVMTFGQQLVALVQTVAIRTREEGMLDFSSTDVL